MIRLCILGCILFLVGFIDASAKIKTTKNGAQIGNSHHRIKTTSGCDGSEVLIEKNDFPQKLPYDGCILNEKGEYIPGEHENNRLFL